MKIGTKVELLQDLPFNHGAVTGMTGKVVGEVPGDIGSFTVEWDKPGFLKSAFSTGESARTYLKIIEEDVE